MKAHPWLPRLFVPIHLPPAEHESGQPADPHAVANYYSQTRSPPDSHVAAVSNGQGRCKIPVSSDGYNENGVGQSRKPILPWEDWACV